MRKSLSRIRLLLSASSAALVLATGLAAIAAAAPVRTEHVEAELVSAQSTIAPGQAVTPAGIDEARRWIDNEFQP